MKAITPNEIDENFTGPEFESAIAYFNEKIVNRSFDYSSLSQHAKEYYGIIIAPFGKYSNKTLDNVVIEFKNKGWDCLHSECYDGRGPHHLFFVAKKHFQ